MRRVAACSALALCAAACAHAPSAPEVLPVAEPANDRVRLYAACTDAAVRAGTVERWGRYVRFTCEGEAARGLYDALAVFSTARGWMHAGPGGVRTRDVTPRAWDDHCTATPGPAEDEHRCILNLAVGDFLHPERDATPAPK